MTAPLFPPPVIERAELITEHGYTVLKLHVADGSFVRFKVTGALGHVAGAMSTAAHALRQHELRFLRSNEDR